MTTDNLDFVEIDSNGFRALVPSFKTLPYPKVLEVMSASAENNHVEAFNRALNLLCENLAPEKMEELREHSVDSVSTILADWFAKSDE